MEKFRNSVKEDSVRFGLSGIEIDKNTVFSDNFRLLNCKKDEIQIADPCFCQKDDFVEAEDYLQEEWNGIPIDCKIVDIIEKLNKQNYKTRFCCSTSYFKQNKYCKNFKQKTARNNLPRIYLF